MRDQIRDDLKSIRELFQELKPKLDGIAFRATRFLMPDLTGNDLLKDIRKDFVYRLCQIWRDTRVNNKDLVCYWGIHESYKGFAAEYFEFMSRLVDEASIHENQNWKAFASDPYSLPNYVRRFKEKNSI